MQSPCPEHVERLVQKGFKHRGPLQPSAQTHAPFVHEQSRHCRALQSSELLQVPVLARALCAAMRRTAVRNGTCILVVAGPVERFLRQAVPGAAVGEGSAANSDVRT